MLRKLKSSSRLYSFFILTVLSGVGTWVGKASDDVPVGFKPDRYQPLWERNPFTIVTPVAQVEQPKAFDKFVLVSWLNDGEKDIVFVQNIETNEVQKITKEPNANSFRLLAIHKAADPKDAEVVLSNGTEEGSVKFRADAVAAAPAQQAVAAPVQQAPGQLAPGQQLAAPMPGIPNQAPAGPTTPAMARQAQTALNGQVPGRLGTNQPGAGQQSEGALPPRASEIRRKRITAPPVTQQPVGAPVPVQNVPGQPQTQ
jgi:hypothetical protein